DQVLFFGRDPARAWLRLQLRTPCGRLRGFRLRHLRCSCGKETVVRCQKEDHLAMRQRERDMSGKPGAPHPGPLPRKGSEAVRIIWRGLEAVGPARLR